MLLPSRPSRSMTLHRTISPDSRRSSGLSARSSLLGNYLGSNGNSVPRPHATHSPDTPTWSALIFLLSHLSTGKRSAFSPLQILNLAWESRRCSADLVFPSRSATSSALTTSTRRLPSTIPANEFQQRISPIDVPGLRNWLTFYMDSLVVDEISPIGSTRANVNPGIYMPHIPKIPKLELRAEGINESTN